MLRIYSVGLDLSLFGTLLNPPGAASSTKAPPLRAYYDDHPVGPADRARKDRHPSLFLSLCMPRLQVHPSGQICPSGGRDLERGSVPHHGVSEGHVMGATVVRPIFGLGRRARSTRWRRRQCQGA